MNPRAAGVCLIFLVLLTRALDAQTIERISIASGGAQADGPSGAFGDGNLVPFATSAPSLSSDGRFVAFASEATNLVASDTNACADVFVRDRLLATTVRASCASTGAQATGASYHPALSADGRFLAFVSYADDLDPLDLHPGADVFVRDLSTGTTRIVSVDPSGGPANDESGLHGWHLGAPDTSRVATLVALSARGRFLAFASRASNLVAGDTNGWDVFVRDLQLGTTTRESLSSSGGQANQPCGMLAGAQGDPGSALALSADGRVVAFTSKATNLDPASTLPVVQLFVRDRVLGTTQVASVGPNGQLAQVGANAAALSANGRLLAFATRTSNWAAGDVPNTNNVFLRDLVSGTTALVDALPGGAPADESLGVALDGPGTRVAFACGDRRFLLPDSNAAFDVYRSTGGVHERVSHGPGGTQADGDSFLPALSADGNVTAFVSWAANLVANDSNATADVFVRW